MNDLPFLRISNVNHLIIFDQEGACSYFTNLSYHAQIPLAQNGLFGLLLLPNHGVYVHVCLHIV